MGELPHLPKPAHLAAQDKVARAIELRMHHTTWETIAAECGYGSRAAAFNAVKREFARRSEGIEDDINNLRAMEVDRLDYAAARVLEVMNTPHYATSGGKLVEGPDGQPLLDDGPILTGATALVRISESYRRLLGLDAAQKVEAAVSVQFTVTGISESELP